jgi:peptide-methionine (S)-S-oxide reductase
MDVSTERAQQRIVETKPVRPRNRGMTRRPAFVALAVVSALAGCEPRPATASKASTASVPTPAPERGRVGTAPGSVGRGTPLRPAPGHELAAFAEGCFWGSENTFRHVRGVTATAVGYTGGHTKDPTYENVCDHTTGHAEAVLVEFDPKVVSYEKLLDVFWATHDPTTKNRQGPDIGDQYRSAIFTFTDAQRARAERSLSSEQKKHARAITTVIESAGPFYRAEDYHQQYDEKTGTESCPLPVRRLEDLSG